MADDIDPETSVEEEGGISTPDDDSSTNAPEQGGSEDSKELSDSDTRKIDLPEISDSVQELRNQLGRLSDKVDSQFVREQNEIRQMQKRMTISLSVIMSFSVISILVTIFSWFSQRGEQSIAEELGDRINSFSLMDSLITDLQRDLDLAGIESENLGEQLLGFQNTLDIAIEQISQNTSEQIGGFEQNIVRLETSVAGFDDKFDAFSDTNLAMSTEIRRVIQSNARLEEFEETLQSLILLEKEKYYDLVTAQIEIQTEENEQESETAESTNVDYIYFSQEQ
ncbi:MAG: hypothetical protein CMD92_07565 [Gammaproteobacteria bacterium]|nr:hypothetical protein [Gammaproteobacteria bacterium]HBW84757.1 hypothetical protein [Gammaproteobacteria bacterium]|tara:strand:- start:15939 stop:16781 length:843 start_codon:yes stop_codon:yes gene_type:complete